MRCHGAGFEHPLQDDGGKARKGDHYHDQSHLNDPRRRLPERHPTETDGDPDEDHDETPQDPPRMEREGATDQEKGEDHVDQTRSQDPQARER
jgi:hypothetical protein